MKPYQENNFQKLLKAIGQEVALTEKEKRSLEWLAGWEAETVENFCSVLNKIKHTNK